MQSWGTLHMLLPCIWLPDCGRRAASVSHGLTTHLDANQTGSIASMLSWRLVALPLPTLTLQDISFTCICSVQHVHVTLYHHIYLEYDGRASWVSRTVHDYEIITSLLLQGSTPQQGVPDQWLHCQHQMVHDLQSLPAATLLALRHLRQLHPQVRSPLPLGGELHWRGELDCISSIADRDAFLSDFVGGHACLSVLSKCMLSVL